MLQGHREKSEVPIDLHDLYKYFKDLSSGGNAESDESIDHVDKQTATQKFDTGLLNADFTSSEIKKCI